MTRYFFYPLFEKKQYPGFDLKNSNALICVAIFVL